TGANWSTNPNAPVSGDGWIFDAPGTAGATLTNNLANSTAFEVAGITFGSTATGGYSISGGTFTLTGNITNTGGAGNQTIGSNIQVSGSRILQLNGGGTVAGDVTLSGNLTGSG